MDAIGIDQHRRGTPVADEVAEEETDENYLDTNHSFIKQALAQGPLVGEELDRRAHISLYNLLYETFLREVDILKSYPEMHPESRQVIARVAEMIEKLGVDAQHGSPILERYPSLYNLVPKEAPVGE